MINKNYLILLICASLITAMSVSSYAEQDDDSIAASGFFPPVQYPDEKETVIGIRSSPGWAKHKNMYGFDFGVIGNITTSNFIGMSLSGIFNRTEGKAKIIFIQAAGLINYNKAKTHIFGMQWTLGVNQSKGENHIYGAQLGLFGNYGKNNIYGLQFGLVNYADHVYGFQIGLVNKAKNLHGIQIGLVNMTENGGIPVFPILNVGF